MTTTSEVRNEIKRMVDAKVLPNEIDESIAVKFGEEFRGEVYEYLMDRWVEQNS